MSFNKRRESCLRPCGLTTSLRFCQPLPWRLCTWPRGPGVALTPDACAFPGRLAPLPRQHRLRLHRCWLQAPCRLQRSLHLVAIVMTSGPTCLTSPSPLTSGTRVHHVGSELSGVSRPTLVFLPLPGAASPKGIRGGTSADGRLVWPAPHFLHLQVGGCTWAY